MRVYRDGSVADLANRIETAVNSPNNSGWERRCVCLAPSEWTAVIKALRRACAAASAKRRKRA